MSLKNKVSGAVAAAVILVTTPFIAKWEGLETTAYRDIVGVPTVCYGETRDVRMGDNYTKAECMKMLQVAVGEYYSKLEPCMTNKNIPVGVQASLLELSYNVGTGAVCKSTMMKLANAGRYKEACNELGKWVKAGGEIVKGLQNRRADSKAALCQKGL